ncbi:AbrB/MazE/SpoVT family DNA-binding domain-containing protein [Clostridium chromiireducens]|uniref:AbrB/MazE/SpoVT family DNA-binding domain-containing protein n=1 Tax=Clostridium chromiireducens TaxID=225345 RepID=A0A1V4IE11_9CLOT|nr:AbrB/MazE/SpoVT family DNA-binding domain-containing protein [Clostridium chromiireducens]OPJ58238.1 transition state regulatory protein AbrB [Clostridium chromiireducens]RII33636.1 AbrB/MazE/SpoVT family DNA-binding domain-containing protein [Clostridium chromiireducens]
MKSLGIVRKVDELGRIVIPKETRKVFTINEGDSLEIFKDDNEIILKKYAPGCTFCGSMDHIFEFKGFYICEECRNNLKAVKK